MTTSQAALSSLLSLAVDAAGEVVVPAELRLFSAGKINTSKGTFTFDDSSAKSVLAAQETRGVRYPFDYGHAMTVPAWMTPDPAESQKAAGWFSVEVRNGELWAVDIKWTELGERKLRAREFAYVSPWFEHTEKRSITQVLNCALTNTPATYGALPMVAASILDDTSTSLAVLEHRQHMKNIAALLSLAVDSSEDTIISRVTALSTQSSELVTITGAKSAAEALGIVASWKNSAALAAELQKKNEEAATAALSSAIDALITQAEKDGKAVPAQRDALKGMGMTSLDTLKGFLGASLKMVPAEKKEAPVGTVVSTLTRDERKVAKQLGMNEADYAASKAKSTHAPMVDIDEDDAEA